MASHFSLYTSFGPKIAFYRAIDSLLRRSTHSSRFDKIFSIQVEKYLQHTLSNVSIPHSSESSLIPIGDDSPIWTMWWQGEKAMPKIVSLCIYSIRLHSGNHPIIILDSNNWHKYVTLDEAQLNALKTGGITLTHLSDIMRVELLKKYGGIWMDSTLYMTDSFDPRLSSSPFWTAHIRNVPQSIKWSNNWSKLWSGYFMASGPNNPLFEFLSDALRQ